MYYISSLIENSAPISHIISNSGLSSEKSIDEQYREFWNFNNEMLKISVLNSFYRIGIYVPDNLVYATNGYYFFPQSSLKNTDLFKQIEKELYAGKKTFITLAETSYSPALYTADYSVLLGTITVASKNDIPRTFITKVEIPVSEYEKILQKVSTFDSGIVYLLDSEGNTIAVSDKALFSSLQKSGNLPQKIRTQWSEVCIPEHGSFYALDYAIQKYGWRMVCLIPVSQYKKQGALILVIITVILVLLSATVLVVSYWLSSFYTKRLTSLSNNMNDLGSGKFKALEIPASPQSGDEIDGIYRNFNAMSKELQRLMDEHYRQGKNVVTAELRALQSQINPHFLYNTLDLINWEAMKYKAGNIATIAQNLGQFYRLSLNHGKAAITIKKELKHVESYVSIENVHFDGAIHLEFIVPEELQTYACLGIILQPFVENSIIHGIAEHPEIKECSITISAESEDNDIIFDIRDNGPGMNAERQKQVLENAITSNGNGYGIQNINSRLKLCYGEPYGVSFDSIPGKGTTVHIRIPLMTLEQLETKLE